MDSRSAKAFDLLDKNVQQILADMFVDMSKDAAEKLGTIKAAGMLDKINTTAEGGVNYKNGEYWSPNMTRAEIADVRSFAKHEVNKTDNYLGINAKWLYNKEKGHEYFALYSTMDAKYPRVLYACKDKMAGLCNQLITNTFQGRYTAYAYYVGRTTAFGELFNSAENAIIQYARNIKSSVRAKSNRGNAIVHSGNIGARFDQAFINSIRNIEEVQQQYGVNDWHQFAVDRDDMKSAQRMVDEAAKKAGFPHKVFNGTSANFDSFNTDIIYVSADKKHAQEYGDNVMGLYTKSEKPYITKDGVIRDENGDPFMLDGEEVTVGWLDAAPDALDYLANNGYDAAWDADMDYVAVIPNGSNSLRRSERDLVCGFAPSSRREQQSTGLLH